MSRSGYSDDCDDQWQLIMWRGAVASALRGKRGQDFLKEMLAALDSMPVKRLIANKLKSKTGDVCALGSVGARRGLNMEDIDVEDCEAVAKSFGIASAMAAEIESINDLNFSYSKETPEQRFVRVRQWVSNQIKGEI